MSIDDKYPKIVPIIVAGTLLANTIVLADSPFSYADDPFQDQKGIISIAAVASATDVYAANYDQTDPQRVSPQPSISLEDLFVYPGKRDKD